LATPRSPTSQRQESFSLQWLQQRHSHASAASTASLTTSLLLVAVTVVVTVMMTVIVVMGQLWQQGWQQQSWLRSRRLRMTAPPLWSRSTLLYHCQMLFAAALRNRWAPPLHAPLGGICGAADTT
jgi:hypothetical protein